MNLRDHIAFAMLGLGALLLTSAALAMFYLRASPVKVEAREVSVVQNKSTHFLLKRGPGMTVRGRVIDINRQKRSLFSTLGLTVDLLSDLGVTAQFAYVSEPDYQALKRDYLDKGRCPAAFLNAHAKLLLLISADRQLQRAIPATLKRFDAFSLKGSFLHLQEGMVKGRPFLQLDPRMAVFLPLEFVKL